MEGRAAREEETPEERVQREGTIGSWEKNGRVLLCPLLWRFAYVYIHVRVCVHVHANWTQKAGG